MLYIIALLVKYYNARHAQHMTTAVWWMSKKISI